jgi:hypothetical protein
MTASLRIDDVKGIPAVKRIALARSGLGVSKNIAFGWYRDSVADSGARPQTSGHRQSPGPISPDG